MSTTVDKQELLRLGDWMPTDPSVQQEWLANIVSVAEKEPADLHPVLCEFGQLIESDSVVNDLFTSTFKELPSKRLFSTNQAPKSPPIRDYKHFLQVLNKLLTTAPTWTDAHNRVGVVGMPINAVLDWPLGASSGLTAFLNPAVNGMIKKVLKAWGQILKSPESATVLNDTSNVTDHRAGRTTELASWPPPTAESYYIVYTDFEAFLPRKLIYIIHKNNRLFLRTF
ncbi:uncharacterized protein ACHE_11033S [Aspergillus chevalieri]|uniref:L-tryptophan decarboxylase PsiD-like domain-containing protein n=1 Tax=Aspergillus chevalieri TaxID=182096 RepID=A0A7R7ZJU4_ASPCH|nr:uncharacterized protein ACHE_11033S [Aspergillus chevalieri]BCR83631.1 hypothetical protein ACHE_11033S [Aspergillus chevalieri]